MTDWNDPDNRVLLYNAMLAKLKSLIHTRGPGKPPDSWIFFLKHNEIGAWGHLSAYGPEDIRYRCPEHVWIHSPEGEVADRLGEDWNYRLYRSFLFIPPDFAESSIKSPEGSSPVRY